MRIPPLEDFGLVAMSEAPEGVRDVLRRRLKRLPPVAVSVLRLAAVVGRDADIRANRGSLTRGGGPTARSVDPARAVVAVGGCVAALLAAGVARTRPR